MNYSERYGSVPLSVTILMTAVVAAAAAAPMYWLPSFGGGTGWLLPLFAGMLTFGALRASVPKRLHLAWVLVGFPLFIGAAIMTGYVLKEAFPPSGGSRNNGGALWMVTMFPVLFLSRVNRKKSRTCRGGPLLAISIVFAVLLLIPTGIAAWNVLQAVQTGQGRVYAALPEMIQFAGIWTGVMLLVGAAMAATMGLRRMPESDIASSPVQ